MPSIGDQLSNTWTHGGIVCIQTTAAHNPGTIVTMLGIPCSIAKIPGWVFSRGKSEWRLYIDCKDIQGTFLQDLFVLEVLIDDFLKAHLERGHDSVGLQDGYLLTNMKGPTENGKSVKGSCQQECHMMLCKLYSVQKLQGKVQSKGETRSAPQWQACVAFQAFQPGEIHAFGCCCWNFSP